MGSKVAISIDGLTPLHLGISQSKAPGMCQVSWHSSREWPGEQSKLV